MKLKLRRWVKVVLYLLLIFVMIVILNDLTKHKTIINEVGKSYVCYGSVIQVCRGENYDIK